MREISLTESALDSHEVETVVLKRLLDESAEAKGTVADAAKQNYSASTCKALLSGIFTSSLAKYKQLS